MLYTKTGGFEEKPFAALTGEVEQIRASLISKILHKVEKNFNWMQEHFHPGFTMNQVCLQVQEYLSEKWLYGGGLGGIPEY